MLELTKTQIRSKILLRLHTQKEEDRNQKSKIIKHKLFRSGIFKKAKRVMFYVSFDGEVNTQDMIRAAQKLGKIIAVPACTGTRSMRPCLFANGVPMIKGPYGVYEPAMRKFMQFRDLDLVIVPGLAFDKRGNRLGRGKGCYDLFLKKIPSRVASIGLAFHFQILPSVPTNQRDARIDRIIYA